MSSGKLLPHVNLDHLPLLSLSLSPPLSLSLSLSLPLSPFTPHFTPLPLSLLPVLQQFKFNYRSLVDDPSFHQSVTKLSNESTPYFSQFRPSDDMTQAVFNTSPKQSSRILKVPSTDADSRQVSQNSLKPELPVPSSSEQEKVQSTFVSSHTSVEYCNQTYPV